MHTESYLQTTFRRFRQVPAFYVSDLYLPRTRISGTTGNYAQGHRTVIHAHVDVHCIEGQYYYNMSLRSEID